MKFIDFDNILTAILSLAALVLIVTNADRVAAVLQGLGAFGSTIIGAVRR